MNLFNEYALLVAVALPVALVAAMQLALFLAGERGTLLVPSLRDFPTAADAPRATKPRMALSKAAPVAQPSNDLLEREAA